jgi:hypothetical protein
MEHKVGDIFVQDAGNGRKFYRIVTAEDTELALHLDRDGRLLSMSTYGPLSLVPEWTTAKYGDPIPVDRETEVPRIPVALNAKDAEEALMGANF